MVDLEIQNSQLKNALHKTEESESQRTIKMYNEEFQLLYRKYENLRVSLHFHWNYCIIKLKLGASEKMWRTSG